MVKEGCESLAPIIFKMFTIKDWVCDYEHTKRFIAGNCYKLKSIIQSMRGERSMKDGDHYLKQTWLLGSGINLLQIEPMIEHITRK